MPRPVNADARKVASISKPLEIKGAKKRKWRSGTVAKRDIVRLQRSTGPLVNKSAIRKSVLFAAQEAGKQDIRFKKNAVLALQEAASTFLVDYFVAADKVRMTERKHKTLQRYHTQIGRATLGVPCIDDTSMPMILPVYKEKSKKEQTSE